MRKRAPNSGISLTGAEVAIVKGMLLRGDRQHDIAAWFGVNGGRVAEISTGAKFARVEPASRDVLPAPGPHPCGRETAAMLEALQMAKRALAAAEQTIRSLAR